jgi:hypothetical protein
MQGMNDSQPPSPRARMQELLAIPDRNRTDEEWDELNELEIALASGNRPGAPDPQSRMTHQRQNNGGQGRQQPGGGGRPQGRSPNNPNNPGKKFHKRSGKRRGGGGGGNTGGGPQQPPQ